MHKNRYTVYIQEDYLNMSHIITLKHRSPLWIVCDGCSICCWEQKYQNRITRRKCPLLLRRSTTFLFLNSTDASINCYVRSSICLSECSSTIVDIFASNLQIQIRCQYKGKEFRIRVIWSDSDLSKNSSQDPVVSKCWVRIQM